MKKIIYSILAVGMTAVIAVPGFAEDLEGEIAAANSRQEELQAEVENSQARLNELQASKADIEQKIAEIDAEIAQVDSLIAQYSSEAEAKAAEIDVMEGQISDQEGELQNKYDKMKVRIKYMYENLDADYIAAIFSSTNFGEMFEKMEYLSALNNYDRKMMDEIETLIDEIEVNKSTVEEELNVVQALGDAQEEQKVVLDDLQVMKSGELSVTEVAIAEEVSEMEAINAMLEANAAQIADLSAEYDAMLAAAAEAAAAPQVDPEAEAAAAAAAEEAARLAEEQAAAQAAAAEAQAAADAAAAEAESRAAEAAAQAAAEAQAQAEAESLAAEEASKLAEEAAAAAAEAAKAEDGDAAAAAAAAAEAQAAADAAAAAQAEAQAAADAAAAAATATATTPVSGDGIATGSWIWPVPGYNTISSGFGPRDGGFHAGIDIPAPEGTSIVAVDGGKVVMARWSPGADTGNYTVIYHGNGVYSEYMHQSNLFVTEGQLVSQGQAIGAVGNTGQSYGSHLHLSKGIGSSYWTNRVSPF